jgi:putative endonuclease
MSRQRAEQGGRRAERLASLWLQLKGWKILGRRVRTRSGEVDLVARRGRTVAFVEVKARATAEEAGLALDEWRLRRVAAAAEALAHATPAPATTSASTRSSSSRAACRGT